MIEVKGHIAGADTVALCKKEVLVAIIKLDCWLLAIVEIDGATTHAISLRRPVLQTLAFAETSITFDKGRQAASAVVVLGRNGTW